MRALNKKAVSAVVSAAAVIFVSIAAAALVAALIRAPLVLLEPAATCTQLAIDPAVRIENAIYNAATDEIEIKLSRSFDDKQISLALSVSGQGESHDWACAGNDVCGCELLSPGSTKTYYLKNKLKIAPETVALKLNNCVIEQKQISR